MKYSLASLCSAILFKDDTVRIEILFPAKSKHDIENASFFKQNNPISLTLSYLKRRNLILNIV